jgi:hypothetical protein
VGVEGVAQVGDLLLLERHYRLQRGELLRLSVEEGSRVIGQLGVEVRPAEFPLD